MVHSYFLWCGIHLDVIFIQLSVLVLKWHQ